MYRKSLSSAVWPTQYVPRGAESTCIAAYLWGQGEMEVAVGQTYRKWIMHKKKSKNGGKFLSWGNPHSAEIHTHSQFKKFLHIHSYIIWSYKPCFHMYTKISHISYRSCQERLRGKVPDHDLSNLPKSDIPVWFYEYFWVKSYKFQKKMISSANIFKFSSQIRRQVHNDSTVFPKSAINFVIIFPIGPFNLSPRFWEPVCNYTWQPHVLNTEASRYPTIFFTAVLDYT